MQSQERTFKLSNGASLPIVGLGSYDIHTKQTFVDGIVQAGHRHIDTAFYYGNEKVIGEAL